MTRLSPRRIQLLKLDAIGAAACAAVSLLFYFLAVAPLLDDHQNHLTQQTELADRRQKLEEQNAAYRSLQSKLAAARGDSAHNPLRLSDANQMNARLAQVMSLATALSLEVNDIQPGEPVAGNRCDRVPVRLAGRGSYQTCTAFLHGLRERFADMGVASFELSADAADPGEKADFRFDLEWFTAPSRPAPPPAPAPSAVADTK